MARNAMLARMETICAEAMEIQQNFLDDDDDPSDSGEADELDEEEIPESIPSDADDDTASQKGNENDGKSSQPDGKPGKRDGKEKGVSVKVNCEDKKQQRYAKWISRALRAAVNPIVSRFNLNLKVNLDLNLANKPNSNTKGSNEPTNSKKEEDDKSKPTPEQSRKRVELARIRELQKENKRLETMFSKIVAAYSDMKITLTQKTTELNELQNKFSESESRVSQLLVDKGTLEGKLADQNSCKDKLQAEVKRIQTQCSLVQDEAKLLKKRMEEGSTLVDELRKKLAELQKKYDALVTRAEKESAEHGRIIDCKQTDIAQLSDQLKKLEEENQSSESKFQSALQEQMQQRTQLELRNVELMQRNRELGSVSSRSASKMEEHTTKVYSTSNAASSFSCPLCETVFGKLGDLQIHIEHCGI